MGVGDPWASFAGIYELLVSIFGKFHSNFNQIFSKNVHPPYKGINSRDYPIQKREPTTESMLEILLQN
jgi:hypothetical protein